jgi:hypothetical protein
MTYHKETIMATIINLTPHPVNLLVQGASTTFPSEGVARAAQVDETVGTIDIDSAALPQVDIVRSTFGEPEGLPEPTPGTYYVVSLLTASAAKAVGRTTSDLLMPAGIVRDAEGRIMGCSKFSQL